MTGHLPWVWNWTAGGWAALAAWATFLVAVVAALYARRQVELARQTREDQAQPVVVVDFEQSKADRIFLDMVIRNTGNTIATNVTFSFDPPLTSATLYNRAKHFLSDVTILKSGIPTLPPGREYRLFFERMPDRYEATDLERAYTAVVRFEDQRNNSYELTYRLDLDIYFGFRQSTIYSEHHSAKALREISDTVKGWTEGHATDGLKVWSRDGDAADERSRAEDAEWERKVAELEERDGEPGEA